MKQIIIDSLAIGPNHPPLVIVEIGINHNGSLHEAKKLVDSAQRAGAKIIKHQTHIVEDEMSKDAINIVPDNADISIYDIMRQCSLNEEEEYELKRYVETKGMCFISTPFSRAAVDRLEKFNVRAYKIGSGECNNYPLVEYIASKRKPIILSTGMNDLSSIHQAVAIIRKYQIPYALMHCTNIYPTPAEYIRLGALLDLQREFPDAVIGLSDHSISNLACLGAVALGADILERHYTDTKLRSGPDIVCSMDEEELRGLIQQSALMFQMRGGGKNLIDAEKNTAKFAYASVVTIKDIKKGDVFSADNLWVKRPGTGDFLAKDYTTLLGTPAQADIAADIQLQIEHVLKELIN